MYGVEKRGEGNKVNVVQGGIFQEEEEKGEEGRKGPFRTCTHRVSCRKEEKKALEGWLVEREGGGAEGKRT